MAYDRIDPAAIRVRPLSDRNDLIQIEQAACDPSASPPELTNDQLRASIDRLVQQMRSARQAGRSIMITYGAHLVKNGAGPLLNALIEDGWVTHLATQGAGIIHDWEFAFQGHSSESVADNAPVGRFGIWDETGRWLNRAAVEGRARDEGWGESLGRLINDNPADHPYRRYSITATAHSRRVPLCVMPGIGYDIYCCHPSFNGGAIGEVAQRDFYTFVDGVQQLDGGVYLSIGSAIMSPQVFEKAFSIANNLRQGRDEAFLADHYIGIVDIQDGGGWDWTIGEPPMDHPAYYLRFCKSFYRMGGTVDYLQADNRLVLAHLVRALCE